MFSSPVPGGGGKFFDFLREVEKTDEKVKQEEDQEAASTPADDPIGELNIEFEKVGDKVLESAV